MCGDLPLHVTTSLSTSQVPCDSSRDGKLQQSLTHSSATKYSTEDDQSMGAQATPTDCVPTMRFIGTLHFTYCVSLELGSTDRSGRGVQHPRERLVYKLRLPTGNLCLSEKLSQRRLLVLTQRQHVSPLCPRPTVYRGTLDSPPVQVQKLSRRAWASVREIFTLVVSEESIRGQI